MKVSLNNVCILLGVILLLHACFLVKSYKEILGAVGEEDEDQLSLPFDIVCTLVVGCALACFGAFYRTGRYRKIRVAAEYEKASFTTNSNSFYIFNHRTY